MGNPNIIYNWNVSFLNILLIFFRFIICKLLNMYYVFSIFRCTIKMFIGLRKTTNVKEI